MHSRLRILVRGIVQGVGFRPTVYRYAKECGLKGFVRNDSGGVTIEVEGEHKQIEKFLETLQKEPPPLARIDSIKRMPLSPTGENSGFEIYGSEEIEGESTAVSLDTTICKNCLKEMRDPSDRRFRYPFINCTDCGPRYSITKRFPYDRKNSSMHRFQMCRECEKEYLDPESRRYHAQPISCPKCGPTLKISFGGKSVEGRGAEAVEFAADLIDRGYIVAVKGLGGFHLMCDAADRRCVERLKSAKGRNAKPFALMAGNIEMVESIAILDDTERELLESRIKPIVLLKKLDYETSLYCDLIAPRIDRIGVMLPYTPLHILLMEMFDRPLVATSANIADEPIITEAKELKKYCGLLFDAILDHDREILNRCDDSIAQVAKGRVVWLRSARGVAPLTIPHSVDIDKDILAVGAQQKNSIAFATDTRIILSPHIGDLSTPSAESSFQRSIERFEKLFLLSPKEVISDLHPNYRSVQWAKSFCKNRPDTTLRSIQHHYAHALSVMAEYGVTEKVLAFVWDGTGYGTDGTVWGGETLIADTDGFERIAHLRHFKILGGEKGVKEPRRSALSILFELYPLEFILSSSLPTANSFKEEEIRVLYRAWEKGLNSPTTSSVGRLFDAVASLAGIVQFTEYEGESGMLIESMAGNETKRYDTDLITLEGDIIDWRPLVRAIAEKEIGNPSAALIDSLANVVAKTAKRFPELPIILCGGVFQNRLLLERVIPLLDKERLLLPKSMPINDGGIALGQIWWAIHRKGRD